jgi:glutathione S-transferase
MTDLILHNYAQSPYAEKIRAVLGYKGLGWQSVEIPRIAPKPDLTALTGGYRRTPVLQHGRDVICDTALIVRLLDRLYPEKLVAPAAHRANSQAWAALEQTLFFAAVATNLQPAGLKVMAELMGPQGLEAFGKDRAALFTGGSARRPNAEFARLHFLPLIHAIDLQLGQGSPYLLGAHPTLADFVAWHPVWFVAQNPGVHAVLSPFKHLAAWRNRMTALGHGSPTPLSAAQAQTIARESDQWLEFDGPLLEPEGMTLGQPVVVRATDYGVDPVEGALIHASVFEIVIARQDPLAGDVRVHFPRAGYSVVPQQTH